MRILLPYLRPHFKLLFAALILAAVGQIASMVDPLILRKVIDQYAMHPHDYTLQEFLSGAALLLLFMISVAFIGRTSKNIQDYIVNVVTQRVGNAIYSDGVRRTIEMPFIQFEDQQSGAVLERLQKVRSDVEKFIAGVINTAFVAIVGFIFMVSYAATITWKIIPAYFITYPLVFLVSTKLSRRIRNTQKSLMKEILSVAGSTTESLRNIELIKSLGLVDQEISRLKIATDKILQLELKKIKYIRSLSFAQGTAINFCRMSLILLNLYLLYTNVITLGQLFSLHICSYFLFAPLNEMGTVMSAHREAEVSLKAFKTILESPIEPRGGSLITPTCIDSLSFEGVAFIYPASKQPSLHQVSMKVNHGETVAFVGPSGAGKSTLIKLLVALYEPTEGKILYGDVPHDNLNRDGYREKIGLVTQETQLFSGTIRENLLFAKTGASEEKCLEALQQAACLSIVERGEKGLDTLIGEGGMKLSGGERQRLAIARALLREPELLVFDEATSSLDSLTELEVSQTIQEISLKRGTITVIVAHRLSTVMHADRIHVLERGVIGESGTHEELLSKKGLYYAMWRQQVGDSPLLRNINSY